MLQTVIPAGYAPCLNLYDTQRAIALLKRLFEDSLGGALHLRRVSAPLFVEASTGLNDDLNGVERPVSFDIPFAGRDAQVVHSLAKWKRMALYRYQFSVGEGLYTDMNAIRRDEELDNLHSVYVDQWDWEKVIAPRDRTEDYLKETVRTIVAAMADTQSTLRSVYPSSPPCRRWSGRCPSSPLRSWRTAGPTCPPRSGRTPGSRTTPPPSSWASAGP